ncbi:heavy metal-responsive transcriptional regulator [Ferrovibrio xuzhouensis]|uniref:Heavy metal-responsive transcriptional regulator n=1 Tax=Ferrovibrio xuzhouensis TaxID=1576914 RepID=A0ABV7VAD1_9PROT
MNIGSVARQSGVTVETLRYYEREGLIVSAGRDANGYRRFEQEAVRRVQFIKRAQEAGFSLKDINGLLSFRASPTTSCPDIRELALLKIDEIDAKIAALARMRTVLATWAEECRDTATISECPILDALEAREEP